MRVRLWIRPWVLAVVAVFAVAIGAWAEIEGAAHRSTAHRKAAQRQAVPAAADQSAADPKPHPKVVVAVPPDQAPSPSGSSSRSAPRPPSDAEVRAELNDLKRQLAALGPKPGDLRVLGDGQVVPPRNAPSAVQTVMQAANAISKFPYKWGGGHGAWRDNGYDCSGSVSFALAAAGFLDSPLTSGNFMNWGEPGPGRWITIYANPGHVWMVVAGMRYDTGNLRGTGHTRWTNSMRSTGGFTAVHPPGY